MADQIITNEAPATNTQWFLLVRLVEQLSLAGWSLVENSDGTTVSAVTEYFTAANFATLGSGSWAVYQANSGQQILFRRSGTLDHSGWIVWSKGGGFTTGGTVTAPANLPVDSAEVRGTFTTGTPGSFSTDGVWFGNSTNTVAGFSIGCRDASGTGDESFWLVGQSSASAYDTSTVHRLAFEKLDHLSGLGIVDATPYAWYCPESSTANWTYGLNDLRGILDPGSASNNGQWRRWWNAGQAGELWKWYGSGGMMGGQGDQSWPTRDQSNLTYYTIEDKPIYQATPPELIRRIRLTKALDLTHKDPEGGITTNIFFSSSFDVPSLATLSSGAYAKFGSFLVVWWDGNASNPPVEY